MIIQCISNMLEVSYWCLGFQNSCGSVFSLFVLIYHGDSYEGDLAVLQK